MSQPQDRKIRVHPTAFVEDRVELAEDVQIWHFAQIRSGARLSKAVSIGKSVYVDSDVTIGEGSRIQNGVNIYKGVEVGRWCFIGPAVVFTNDQTPRVGRKNWNLTKTNLEDGCSLGAGSIIRCGITLGAFSMIGAGAVVTKDIPPFCLVTGLPAELTHRICACGDTTMPLIEFIDNVIRPCCHKNLIPEVLKVAQDRVSKLKTSGKS